jgi:hypothetical protein
MLILHPGLTRSRNRFLCLVDVFEDESLVQEEGEEGYGQDYDRPGNVAPDAVVSEDIQEANIYEIGKQVDSEEAEDQPPVLVVEYNSPRCSEVEQDTADLARQSCPFLLKAQPDEQSEDRIPKYSVEPSHCQKTKELN